MQVLLAPDLERIVGLPQGHIFHGELAPDQVFFSRPAAHYADYRTPIRRPLDLRQLDAPGRRGERDPGPQRGAGDSEGPGQAARSFSALHQRVTYDGRRQNSRMKIW